jgi:hypothetical protein
VRGREAKGGQGTAARQWSTGWLLMGAGRAHPHMCSCNRRTTGTRCSALHNTTGLMGLQPH